MNGNWYGLDAHYEAARAHQQELRKAAEHARLVRLARGPAPWRRALGLRLIAVGESLAGRRVEAAREPLPPPPLPAAADELLRLHVVCQRDSAA